MMPILVVVVRIGTQISYGALMDTQKAILWSVIIAKEHIEKDLMYGRAGCDVTPAEIITIYERRNILHWMSDLQEGSQTRDNGWGHNRDYNKTTGIG